MNSFGSLVFNSNELKKRLSQPAFEQFLKIQQKQTHMTHDLAEKIAAAMLDWSLTNGATHYCHWFQPLTGGTAEKHDSFLDSDKSGAFLTKFSASNLIKGEADASSLPNGSVRSTFEARGYTVWDSSSPAFIKVDDQMKVLCIPTAFCTFSGATLDEKTPLLRSCDQLAKQALRVLKIMGNTTSQYIKIYAGPEQEYFLIDQAHYQQREDLKQTGRTLFGNIPAKSQQLRDQYYGQIKPRVLKFMQQLNQELYKLGVPAKTQHNEVAPAQHELATIYNQVQIAMDQNQIVMETMKKVALKHGLQCLLHEKPFDNLNGSGKHNNWSFGTDEGENLLDPGDSPQKNKQFLIYFLSVVAAVDKYAELLRLSTAYPANEYRLGGHEAPPTIISIYCGEQLMEIVEQLARKSHSDKNSPTGLLSPSVTLGVDSFPKIPRDTSDRNRTSPFAFTGNKFEFRMVGSSQSIGVPNSVLNTAVAQILKEVADEFTARLDKHEEFDSIYEDIVSRLAKDHKRVIFNGNGYSSEWKEEAERRGLPIFTSCVDVFKHILDEKSVKLFVENSVMSEDELKARLHIYNELFVNTVLIEADCMTQMARKQILPCCTNYLTKIAAAQFQLQQIGLENMSIQQQVVQFNQKISQLMKSITDLEEGSSQAKVFDEEHVQDAAKFVNDNIKPKMMQLRSIADWMEANVEKSMWCFPSYTDILFYE
ncbi:Glutamine_synthetase [Hexamita inflata]|uniref:Glutamine synthetase n=1 Tax=Hexamita inflata TaxID=28002 RepID=A0AA86TUA2_9EUKA|nr:Glutamine synthetase [Hexamita inflata]